MTSHDSKNWTQENKVMSDLKWARPRRTDREEKDRRTLNCVGDIK
jgi:hypothetical protein